MNITDVRLRKLPTEGKLKAIVSVTFDNEVGDKRCFTIARMDANITNFYLFVALSTN